MLGCDFPLDYTEWSGDGCHCSLRSITIRGVPTNTQAKHSLLRNNLGENQTNFGPAFKCPPEHPGGTFSLDLGHTLALFPCLMLIPAHHYIFGCWLCHLLSKSCMLLRLSIRPFLKDFQSNRSPSRNNKQNIQKLGHRRQRQKESPRWIKSWLDDFDSGNLSSSCKKDHVCSFQWAWYTTLDQGF